MKRLAIISLIIGIVLMLASVVITFVSASNVSVVGGADWSTFMFYFDRLSWLARIGGCVAVASIIVLLMRKK